MARPRLSNLRVGIYGPGEVAGYHIGAYLANPYCEVVAVCGRDRPRAEARVSAAGLSLARVSIFTELQQMLDTADLDLVSICVPNFLHAPAVVQSARARKHLLIEKPVCLRAEEIPPMIAAVREAGVRTAVAFRLRFSPHIVRLKQWVEEGAFGRIEYIESTYVLGIRALGKPWLRDGSAAGDCLTVLGCHAFDLVRYLSRPGRPQDIVEVEASLERAEPELPYASRGLVFCSLADGTLARVGADMGGSRPFHLELNLRGSLASALQGQVHFEGRGRRPLPDPAPGDPRAGGVEYQGMVNHLVDCIREGRESHCNLADAVNTHLSIFTASHSADAGGRVRIPSAPAKATHKQPSA